MKINHKIAMLFFVIFVPFSITQGVCADDYFNDINVADQKVILQEYDEAKKIYNKIIKSADFSVVKAYAHYKLGALYKQQNEFKKAKEEYKKGILSLKNAGQSNHQIGRYLEEALQYTG
ncbi:MAG: hypothetical protein JKY45_13920 [Emcibacter sp.]|nr:hypothetical protein [Emcibacter sp.]